MQILTLHVSHVRISPLDLLPGDLKLELGACSESDTEEGVETLNSSEQQIPAGGLVTVALEDSDEDHSVVHIASEVSTVLDHPSTDKDQSPGARKKDGFDTNPDPYKKGTTFWIQVYARIHVYIDAIFFDVRCMELES